MTTPHSYQATLLWTGAREGPTTSYAAYARAYTVQVSGKPPLLGSADPTFLGDAARHNPEDLLLIALSACHMLSYLALCARGGIAVLAYADPATATMAPQEGKMRFTEAILHPKVVIAPGADRERAIELHHQAHDECFIASSVAFPVRAEPIVLFADDPSAQELLETTIKEA